MSSQNYTPISIGIPGAPKYPDTIPPFASLTDLVNEKVGGETLWTTNDFFAARDNLVRDAPAKWDSEAMTERGKWMDGWESQRHNKQGVEICLLRLGLAGALKGVDVDTSHFHGNHCPEVQVEAINISEYTNVDDLLAASWTVLVPRSRCHGCYHNYFAVIPEQQNNVFTHIKLNMYPDGGIARFRAYGDVQPAFLQTSPFVDLALANNGGLVVAASDSHFSSRNNLIVKANGINMKDGWETKRSRVLDHSEWAIVRLGVEGKLSHIEIDTRHFKGNPPDFCLLEGTNLPNRDTEDWSSVSWTPIVPKSPLHPHRRHFFHKLENSGPFTHVRLIILPDGGVSRMRVYGTPAQ